MALLYDNIMFYAYSETKKSFELTSRNVVTFYNFVFSMFFKLCKFQCNLLAYHTLLAFPINYVF